jgi:2-C-methyl-D-erythritol 4-phosphate cytidylyltransferase
MWQAQTPQVFKSEIILSAYDKAKSDHFEGTDSASLVERLGIPIHLVETTRFNFKITTPEDLEIAEIILSHRKDS